MPVRRMRCSACGKAKLNYSKLMVAADPDKRVCEDCEGQAAQTVSPPAPTVAPPQPEQYVEPTPPPQELSYEEETPAREQEPVSVCPHMAELHAQQKEARPLAVTKQAAAVDPKLICAFAQWVSERHHEMTPEMVDDIVESASPFLRTPAPGEKVESVFAEAVLRGLHKRVVRRVAGPETIPDDQIDELWEEIKKGNYKEMDYEASPRRPVSRRLRSGGLLRMAPDAPIQRSPPFDGEYYKLAAEHFHEDPYYTDQQRKDGKHDFQPDLNSKYILRGHFSADQHMMRIPIKNNADYQQPNVQEPLSQGGNTMKRPETWEGFRQAFNNLELFSEYFQATVPSTYPTGCDSDVKKIEFILGLWGTRKIQNMVANWDKDVSADVLVVPPPKVGKLRFQPAFAGLFFFYDTPMAVQPSVYIIMGATGTGEPTEMYVNRVTSEMERSVKQMVSQTGTKFTPVSSANNFYAHGLQVQQSKNRLVFKIDVFYAKTPPTDKNSKPYVTINTVVTAESAAHNLPFVKATVIKGTQMERFTTPYLPPGTSEATAFRLVFNPTGTDNILSWLGMEGAGAAVAFFMDLFHVTDKELGIDIPPHAVPK